MHGLADIHGEMNDPFQSLCTGLVRLVLSLGQIGNAWPQDLSLIEDLRNDTTSLLAVAVVKEAAIIRWIVPSADPVPIV